MPSGLRKVNKLFACKEDKAVNQCIGHISIYWLLLTHRQTITPACAYMPGVTISWLLTPQLACAARVTVFGLHVCVSVWLSVFLSVCLCNARFLRCSNLTCWKALDKVVSEVWQSGLNFPSLVLCIHFYRRNNSLCLLLWRCTVRRWSGRGCKRNIRLTHIN